MNKIAYLGPEGTFTQQALIAFDPDAAACPMPSVDAALAAVGAGEVDAAMVPMENSLEGGVPATLDALADADSMYVVSEQLMPVTFVLAARPGTRPGDIRHVGTHPHAWAQVRRFARAVLPCAIHVPTLSTAAGAAALANGTAVYDATVCAPVAAANHGLEVLAEDIGDSKVAVTRFVLVAQRGALPAPTGADKTTVVLFQREDRAGGLLELLDQFATRGINMIRIESRPTGAAMGSYYFSIDFEGHVRDERVGEALMGLRRLAADMRFLGSYPRADRRRVPVEPATSDPSFIEARAWLRSLRRGNPQCQLPRGDAR
jgi:prephenate dehydratase